jgi:hypothetical protein
LSHLHQSSIEPIERTFHPAVLTNPDQSRHRHVKSKKVKLSQ